MTLFLFLGSIGIGIFSHACVEDGVSVSYFAADEDICGKHEHEQVQAIDDCDDCCCCDEDESAKDDCCSTSSELLKVKLDYLNKIQVKAILFNQEAPAPVWVVDVPLVTEEIAQASGSDPPPKPGRERLIDIQTWLI